MGFLGMAIGAVIAVFTLSMISSYDYFASVMNIVIGWVSVIAGGYLGWRFLPW